MTDPTISPNTVQPRTRQPSHRPVVLPLVVLPPYANNLIHWMHWTTTKWRHRYPKPTTRTKKKLASSPPPWTKELPLPWQTKALTRLTLPLFVFLSLESFRSLYLEATRIGVGRIKNPSQFWLAVNAWNYGLQPLKLSNCTTKHATTSTSRTRLLS